MIQKIAKIGLVLVLLINAPSIVAAQSIYITIDNYEDGELSNPTNEKWGSYTQQSGSIDIVENSNYDSDMQGTYSLRIGANAQSSSDTPGKLDLGSRNESIQLGRFAYEMNMLHTPDAGDRANLNLLNDTAPLVYVGFGSGNRVEYFTSAEGWTVLNDTYTYPTNEMFEVEYIMNYENRSTEVYIDGQFIGNASMRDFNVTDVTRMQMNVENADDTVWKYALYDNIRWSEYDATEQTPTPTPTSNILELDVDNWQALNSTQDYAVFLENDTSRSEVTGTSNVTTSNSTIIRVNTGNSTLQSFNLIGKVVITAEYKNKTVTENVTTGPRTLDNIDIMPNTQWINSFLEVGDATGGHNVGSDTQWLIFIIIVMVAFARSLENDWVGIGCGLLTCIMLWVVDFVGLGMMLTVTFFAIFVGTLKVRVSRNNDSMEIDINDTREFR